MASSKVVTTNPDLPRQSSICSLSNIIADFQQHMQQQQLQEDDDEENPSKSPMDDLLKNLYSSSSSEPQFQDGTSSSMSRELGNKTVDEVWKEIVSGGGENVRQTNPGEEMTLEDFLTKAGAGPVREDDVRVPMLPPPPPPPSQGVHYTSTVNANTQFTQPPAAVVGFDGRGVVVGGGRGKRRAVQEAVVDKATQQKQRRMIKNRESAARSRERKQAYTVELESLVTQLEEENARLRKEEADQKKERFKQLMQNLIPVEEKRRPPRTLRRVNSMHW